MGFSLGVRDLMRAIAVAPKAPSQMPARAAVTAAEST